ncbi:hypothetical protein RvY_16480 [Ramazzottius varieornatus]|uniref:Uncharacterized protein n=1 Tax=Ramazzottius varieornatus TaxID=947166 RepID=A0A1D1VYL4_RAMVA|nr:hypothetical protein RvY_16480 [Ramazzottius varieornatus]
MSESNPRNASGELPNEQLLPENEEPALPEVPPRRQLRPRKEQTTNKKQTQRLKHTKRLSRKAKPTTTPAAANPTTPQCTLPSITLEQVVQQMHALTAALSRSNLTPSPVVLSPSTTLQPVFNQASTSTPNTQSPTTKKPERSPHYDIDLAYSSDESSSDEAQSSEPDSDIGDRRRANHKRKYHHTRQGPLKLRKSDYDTLCDSPYLPPVKEGLLKALFDERQYVKISDLTKENRIPGAEKTKGHSTQVTTDAETGQLVLKPATKVSSITTFTEYVECFTVLMAYRVTVNPKLALPMTSYLNFMAELAHPDRGFPSDKWLAYDARLRITAARYPTDLSLWSTVHADIKQRTCLTNSNGPSISREHGHKVQVRVTESYNQPFRTNPAADGEICKRYNRGQCPDEPCPNAFSHSCSYCKKPGHTRFYCNRNPDRYHSNDRNQQGDRSGGSRHTAQSLNSTKV